MCLSFLTCVQSSCCRQPARVAQQTPCKALPSGHQLCPTHLNTDCCACSAAARSAGYVQCRPTQATGPRSRVRTGLDLSGRGALPQHTANRPAAGQQLQFSTCVQHQRQRPWYHQEAEQGVAQGSSIRQVNLPVMGDCTAAGGGVMASRGWVAATVARRAAGL